MILVQSFLVQTSSLPPVLTFHDTTPLLGMGSSTGRLQLDQGVARVLGVDGSFWIAIALAYLEFLDEKDVSFRASRVNIAS
jgi:hypothetical protein